MSSRHEETLITAVEHEDPVVVQIALGRFKGNNALAAAKRAAKVAASSERWDNLAYLSDYIQDMSQHVGSAEDGEIFAVDDEKEESVMAYILKSCIEKVTGEPYNPEGEATPEKQSEAYNCASDTITQFLETVPDIEPKDRQQLEDVASEFKSEAESITAFIEQRTPTETRGGLDYDSLIHTAGRTGGAKSRRSKKKSSKKKILKSSKVSKHSKKKKKKKTSQVSIKSFVTTRPHPEIEFKTLYEDAAPGEWGSPEIPGSQIFLHDADKEIERLVGADAKVISTDRIQVLYDYPFCNAGPSAVEKEMGGWIFEEVAPEGQNHFTREDLARSIVARYRDIYGEEEKTTKIKAGTIPGMYNRNQTNGMYGIYGHVIEDLAVGPVYYDPVKKIYYLGMSS